MALETDAAEAGGEDTFAQEMDAAREADAALDAGAPGEGAEGEIRDETQAGDKRPPLPPEEVARRLEDQKRATRAERVKRQELETTLKTVQARLDELSAGRGQQQGPDLGERPNPTEDPIGYLEYVEAMIAAQAETQAQTQQQQEAQQRAQQETQAVVSRVAEYENDFRETTPDYDAAVEHLYAAKKAEYTDTGYDDAEAHNMVMAEFLTRSKRAFAAGKDPAEIVYTLAKRAGYAPKGGADKLAAIERGQRATSPLASTGARASGELTVESVGNLRGAAFDTAFAKLRERAIAVERASGL